MTSNLTPSTSNELPEESLDLEQKVKDLLRSPQLELLREFLRERREGTVRRLVVASGRGDPEANSLAGRVAELDDLLGGRLDDHLHLMVERKTNGDGR